MKICQVVPCFPYLEHIEGREMERNYHIGGVERHVYELTKSLIERGHDVTVLTTKSPMHHIYNDVAGIKITRIPYGLSIYSSSIPLKVLFYLKSEDYDIIHAHTPNPMISDLACLKNRKRVPFVLTVHNDIIKEGFAGRIISAFYSRSFGRMMLQESDRIIATTMSYARSSKQLHKYDDKIVIVPNGVNPYLFQGIDGSLIRQRYSISQNTIVILFLGVLEDYKGVDRLINAFKMVHEKYPHTHLLIVGNGGLMSSLQNLAERLGITKSVTFSGYVPDCEIPLYLSACDVFVLPSISGKEGFGIVQLEAMASGKPVISTDIPGVNEVDKECVGSIRVPPDNPEAISGAIVSLIDDRALAGDLGENGRKLVFSRYSWGRISERIESVYRELLE